MPEFHSSASAISELRARFPQTPFLTLGQTVWWDEPVKAAFCRILEVVAPDAVMMAAVHDTDYFAKLSRLENETQGEAERREKFALLSHNDGDTRGLWSAAGEIACLFGSETVPTRQLLTENGVEFDRVARDYPGGAPALLNEETPAWGWRALVQTQARSMIAGDVKLRDIGPTLTSQIEWAVNSSLQIAWPPHNGVCEACATEARENATQIFAWTRDYLNQDPDGTLSDFYRWLTPRLWAMVRGTGSCNLTTSTSLRLFKFNRETCQMPRFEFVDLFLNAATKDIAQRCYNDAVRGSGIYTLDQFGPGALPFDVVIPGKGRGTLHLNDGTLSIDTEPRQTIQAKCENVAQLAEILESNFGAEVALVGKAVSLISMLAKEFIFVFHEKASSYTKRTQAMNEALRGALRGQGIKLELHPMLRLKYATWDALSQARAVFDLPPHLASAFGQNSIAAGEFAARWSDVCDAQDALRSDLKNCRSPRELLLFLSRRLGGAWTKRCEEFHAAHDVIAAMHQQTSTLKSEIESLRQEAREATLQAAQIERAKGEDFRAHLNPLRQRLFDIKEAQSHRFGNIEMDAATGKPRKLSKEEREASRLQIESENQEIEALRQQMAAMENERAHFDVQIAQLRETARQKRAFAKQNVREKLVVERSENVAGARQTRRELRYEAELERLRRTRDAIMTSDGLRYTNYRPTAWWFPLVSPDGKWLDQLVQTAQLRVEEI